VARLSLRAILDLDRLLSPPVGGTGSGL